MLLGLRFCPFKKVTCTHTTQKPNYAYFNSKKFKLSYWACFTSEPQEIDVGQGQDQGQDTSS